MSRFINVQRAFARAVSLTEASPFDADDINDAAIALLEWAKNNVPALRYEAKACLDGHRDGDSAMQCCFRAMQHRVEA